MERAILETLEEILKIVSFQHGAELFERLTTLKPKLMDTLLAACRSLKSKRLFLYFASQPPRLGKADKGRRHRPRLGQAPDRPGCCTRSGVPDHRPRSGNSGATPKHYEGNGDRRENWSSRSRTVSSALTARRLAASRSRLLVDRSGAPPKTHGVTILHLRRVLRSIMPPEPASKFHRERHNRLERGSGGSIRGRQGCDGGLQSWPRRHRPCSWRDDRRDSVRNLVERRKLRQRIYR
ncbi:type IV toxin-antitoxin system AbiEi family antitoxin domain-containing protein [Sphingomonas crocodyli]